MRLRLAYTWLLYLYLDANYGHMRHQGRAVSHTALIDSGFILEGRREILSVSVGDAKNTDFLGPGPAQSARTPVEGRGEGNSVQRTGAAALGVLCPLGAPGD